MENEDETEHEGIRADLRHILGAGVVFSYMVAHRI
jgi:hypothetical protein